MNLKNKQKISWILLIGWMAFIFIMSHQPGEVSSKQSNFVIYVFNALGLNLSDKLGDLATFIVRKGAHFSEYMILLFLVYNVLRFYINNSKARILGVIIVFLYACTDEFHQLFIEGRSGQFKDVLIDTFGGAFGALITLAISKFKKNK